MRHIYYIAIMAASLLASLPAMAQEGNGNNQQRRSPQASRGERNDQKESDTPDLTVRAQDLNERLTQEIGNARWTRVIYRQLNLVDEQNAPLYYPTQSINGQRNLFSTIFQLLGENKIKAYEYLDGYEEFTDEHLVNFKEMLDRFHIYYEEVPGKRGEEPGFVINESDIPSADVRSLYVKEAWYFDQNNSMFDVNEDPGHLPDPDLGRRHGRDDDADVLAALREYPPLHQQRLHHDLEHQQRDDLHDGRLFPPPYVQGRYHQDTKLAEPAVAGLLPDTRLAEKGAGTDREPIGSLREGALVPARYDRTGRGQGRDQEEQEKLKEKQGRGRKAGRGTKNQNGKSAEAGTFVNAGA